MQKSYKLLWICGIILAAAIGFFASAAIFKGAHPTPPPNDEMQVFNNEMPIPAPEADSRKGQLPKPNFDFKHHMDSALGLSAEQIAKMDSNGKACDTLRREMWQKIHRAEQHLHDVLAAEKIDEAELQSVRAELLLLNEKRLDMRIADVKFFKSVLSAEQENKFKDMQKEWMQKKKKHHSKQFNGEDGKRHEPKREDNHKRNMPEMPNHD